MSKPKKTKKDYKDKLLGIGVPESLMKSKKYGKRINKGEYKKILAKWKEKQDQFYATVPDEIKANPNFKNLSYDAQQFAIQSYNIQLENNEDKARKMDEAFNMAVNQADPYWKQIIRIAQDETIRRFDEAKGDYEATAQRIQRRQDELQQDISLNKERLTIDEQKTLLDIDRKYTEQTEQVINIASQRGITFGSGTLSRAGIQKKVDDQNDSFVESTKRSYGREIMDLTTKALRGDKNAKDDLAKLEETYGNRVTEIGRKAEKFLGSSRVNDLQLGNYQKLGNVTGSLEEEKTKDIQIRKESLFNELNQDSLNFNNIL